MASKPIEVRNVDEGVVFINPPFARNSRTEKGPNLRGALRFKVDTLREYMANGEVVIPIVGWTNTGGQGNDKYVVSGLVIDKPREQQGENQSSNSDPFDDEIPF